MEGEHNIALKWWKATRNWGDVINPYLYEQLSGRPAPRHIGEKNPRRIPNYMIAGSVLKWADEESIVWGPGFLTQDDRLRVRPRRICAVRGPLSRAIILGQGIPCPEVLGDPALLFPRLLDVPRTSEYDLGIIPHYVDKKHPWLRRLRHTPEVLVINVQGGICEFIHQVCRCKAIASSSLHGVIIADAYAVPSLWIEFSDRIVGNGFKFRDYFASVGRIEREPVRIQPATTVRELQDRMPDYTIQVDLDALLAACPFMRKE